MPPPLLIDLSAIDFNKITYDAGDIEEVNPQRFEMRQLDGIIHIDAEARIIIGYKDVTQNEFWVRGHIPGRPLMPGVIMIEAAAQLASFAAIKVSKMASFIGFCGIEEVKFRAQVIPGQRLYILGKFPEIRRRRFKLATQGIVNGQLVFEGTVIGMPI